jgi:hypothetical protein
MPRRRALQTSSGLLALLLPGVLACAASAAFDGTLYRGSEVSFRLSPLPATWRKVSLPSADLAFRDEPRDASILINSRCSSSDRDAPLVSLTDHLIIGTTDRHVSREETIPFDAREARHTVLTARLDGVPMLYDMFVLKKDGCVFDLVYVAAPDAATTAAGVAEFDQFVQGFHTVQGAP